MTRDEEARLTAEYEAEIDNEELWEEVPAPSPYHRRRLGTQVTIRLEPDDAERLRKLARRYDTNYTSMLRVWIEQRLRAEVAALSSGKAVPPPAMPPDAQGGWPRVTMTGAGRLMGRWAP